MTSILNFCLDHIIWISNSDSVGVRSSTIFWCKNKGLEFLRRYEAAYDLSDSELDTYDSIDSISTDYNYDDYDPTKYVRRNLKRHSVPGMQI